MITPSLLLLASLYGVLSFLMAAVIWRLPVWCQSSWFLISSWGILWVGVGYAIYDPSAYPHVVKLAVIFLFALPGMMYLDYKQRKARLLHWEKEGVPEEIADRFIYLGEVLDYLAEWWMTKRSRDRAIYEAMDIVNGDTGHADDHHYSVDEVAD